MSGGKLGRVIFFSIIQLAGSEAQNQSEHLRTVLKKCSRYLK